MCGVTIQFERPMRGLPSAGGSWPVSYTHLDVYKRQAMGFRDLRKGETLTGQNSAVWVMERLSAPDGDESSSEERAV